MDGMSRQYRVPEPSRAICAQPAPKLYAAVEAEVLLRGVEPFKNQVGLYTLVHAYLDGIKHQHVCWINSTPIVHCIGAD